MSVNNSINSKYGRAIPPLCSRRGGRRDSLPPGCTNTTFCLFVSHPKNAPARRYRPASCVVSMCSGWLNALHRLGQNSCNFFGNDKHRLSLDVWGASRRPLFTTSLLSCDGPCGSFSFSLSRTRTSELSRWPCLGLAGRRCRVSVRCSRGFSIPCTPWRSSEKPRLVDMCVCSRNGKREGYEIYLGPLRQGGCRRATAGGRQQISPRGSA